MTATSAVADGIDPTPIGLLDKLNVGNVEQSDFFTIDGPVGRDPFVTKLLFTAKVKDVSATMEQRALFVQPIYRVTTSVPASYVTISKAAPLTKLATYTVTKGTVFDSFLPTARRGDQSSPSGSSRAIRFNQMYFHVPGRGMMVTEGGKAPKVVRPESFKDGSTAIRAGAFRLPSYRSNNTDDLTEQGRFFYFAKDATKGREPFIYNSASSVRLADLVPGPKQGSDPDFASEFATFGPENDTQLVVFSAANPADNNTYQLWTVGQPSLVRNKPVYSAVPFTTGSSALVDKPRNLVANGSDLYFTAATTAGSTPVLWHLPFSSGVTAAGLTPLPAAVSPSQLTLNSKDLSYSELVFSAFDGTAFRYTRYSPASNTVTTLGASVGYFDPYAITDAGQEFYFAAYYTDASGTFSYLLRHDPSDNALTPIVVGSAGNFAYNIGEIRVVTSQGSTNDGTVYFTGSAFVDGGYKDNLLFKMPANAAQSVATVVRTAGGAVPIVGARNLRDIVARGSGIFRLYFSAPVSSTANSSFIPVASKITDFGTKPWVVAESGN